MRRFYLKEPVFEALTLEIYAEMIRKAFRKNYRSKEIDLQGGEVPILFENSVF